MIVKLTKAGGIVRHIEATRTQVQPTANGDADLEIVTPAGEFIRALISHGEQKAGGPELWGRAYVMEHGKTVDTINPPPRSLEEARSR